MASTRIALSRLQRLSGILTPARSPISAPVTSSARSRLGIRNMASTQIPKTMKGVHIERTGGVEVLQYKTDLPVPTPKEGEILVKNEVCGVNYIDTYFRTGLYPSPMPLVLGREAAGHAVTTSSANSAIKEGTRVVYMGKEAYAEYTAVDAASVQAVPDGVSLSTAAAAMIQGLTGLTLIDEAYKVKKGDWILVPAAAGGMGTWLCQLLRQRGAHTIATASTEAKRKMALEFGAEIAVPYDEALDAVKKHTNGKGVAAVLDGVGQATFETALQAVARKGEVVSFGNASGAVEPFKISRLAEKNVKVCRPTLFNYVKEPEELDYYMKRLWEALGKGDGKGGDGTLKVEIYKTYPLSEIKQVHTDLEGRKTTGKLLLDPTK